MLSIAEKRTKHSKPDSFHKDIQVVSIMEKGKPNDSDVREVLSHIFKYLNMRENILMLNVEGRIQTFPHWPFKEDCLCTDWIFSTVGWEGVYMVDLHSS